MTKKKSVFDDIIFDEDFFKEDEKAEKLKKKEESTLYKYCMKCGEEVKKTSKYCSECGTSMFYDTLEEYQASKNNKYCKNCGEENAKKAKFCSECGCKEFYDNLVEMKVASDKEVNSKIDEPKLNTKTNSKSKLNDEVLLKEIEENRKIALKKAAEEKKKQDALKKAEEEKKLKEEMAKNSGESEYNESFKHRKSGEYAKEIDCLKRAAAKGHTYAMYNLGVYYRGGKNVPQNRETARNYFSQGALKQNPCCEYLLGILNEEDSVREVAYRYFKLAGDHGHPYGCHKVYKFHMTQSKIYTWYPSGGEETGVNYLIKGSEMVMTGEMSFLKNGPDLCKRELGKYYYEKAKKILLMTSKKKSLLESALSCMQKINTKDANDDKLIKEIQKLLK